MRRAYHFILLLLFCTAIRTNANGETYTIGVEGTSYYPHSYSEDGNYRGFGRELLDLFAKHQGCTVVYKPYSVENLSDHFYRHDVQFRYPDNPIWDFHRKSGIAHRYSDPIVSNIDGIIVRKENLGKGIQNIARLGTISGFSLFELEDLPKSERTAFMETIVQTEDAKQLLELVLTGEVDGAFLSLSVAHHTISSQPKMTHRLAFDAELPYTISSYRLSTNSRPDVIDQFNRFLIAEGAAIRRLKKKFHLDNVDRFIK